MPAAGGPASNARLDVDEMMRASGSATKTERAREGAGESGGEDPRTRRTRSVRRMKTKGKARVSAAAAGFGVAASAVETRAEVQPGPRRLRARAARSRRTESRDRTIRLTARTCALQSYTTTPSPPCTVTTAAPSAPAEAPLTLPPCRPSVTLEPSPSVAMLTRRIRRRSLCALSPTTRRPRWASGCASRRGGAEGRWDFFFFQVVLVEFLARERSRGFENFLGAANSLQKYETNNGLFWVYFARYMTPRPQRPRPRREVVVVLDRAADSCARQARDSRAQALDVRPRPRDVLVTRARARGDRARRVEFAVRTPVTGIGGAKRI